MGAIRSRDRSPKTSARPCKTNTPRSYGETISGSQLVKPSSNNPIALRWPQRASPLATIQSLMTDNLSTDLHKVLAFYKINSTPVRLRILRAIYDTRVEFTIQQIQKKLNTTKPTISSTTLKAFVRLGHTRGLLTRHHKKGQASEMGRPAIWYSLSGSHILSIL